MDHSTTLDEDALWRLGWRMIESEWDENKQIAEAQFDSLLTQKNANDLELKFIITGLKIKSDLSKSDELVHIFSEQTEERKTAICERELFQGLEICSDVTEEEIENKELALEIVKMYVDDQAARGNIMEELIRKYELDTTQILTKSAVSIDEINRERLKVIIDEFGFPTKALIGRDAMIGVFFIIQHADRDKAWQKSQFPNIELAVERGDLDAQKYAYLYDRVKANNGEKQRYGTQFAKVDPIEKIVELKATEDIEHLDARRREKGMMPIEMYKRLVFSNM